MSDVRVVIPYNTGDTATAWCESIGDYVNGQLTSTKSQLLSLASDLGVDIDIDNPHILSTIVDESGISFDRIAVVELKHLDYLADLSSDALDHGSDRSLYAACGRYNQELVKVADLTFPI